MTRAVWAEVEEAEVGTEPEVMTEATAPTAGAEGRLAGMAVEVVRGTTRASPSTGAPGVGTATQDLPGEATWQAGLASGWGDPAMAGTATIPGPVEEDTGQEGAPGDREAGGDTRTEGINDEDGGEDDVDSTLIENLSSVLF